MMHQEAFLEIQRKIEDALGSKPMTEYLRRFCGASVNGVCPACDAGKTSSSFTDYGRYAVCYSQSHNKCRGKGGIRKSGKTAFRLYPVTLHADIHTLGMHEAAIDLAKKLGIDVAECKLDEKKPASLFASGLDLGDGAARHAFEKFIRRYGLQNFSEQIAESGIDAHIRAGENEEGQPFVLFPIVNAEEIFNFFVVDEVHDEGLKHKLLSGKDARDKGPNFDLFNDQGQRKLADVEAASYAGRIDGTSIFTGVQRCTANPKGHEKNSKKRIAGYYKYESGVTASLYSPALGNMWSDRSITDIFIKDVIVVESCMNAVALHVAGFTAVSAMSAANIRNIAKWLYYINPTRKVFVWYDRDADIEQQKACKIKEILGIWHRETDKDKNKGFDVVDLFREYQSLAQFRDEVNYRIDNAACTAPYPIVGSGNEGEEPAWMHITNHGKKVVPVLLAEAMYARQNGQMLSDDITGEIWEYRSEGPSKGLWETRHPRISANIYRGQIQEALYGYSALYARQSLIQEVFQLLIQKAAQKRSTVIMDDSPLIPLRNGVLDPEKGQLEDYRPDHFFSQRLPVIYDPDAECPNFLRMVGDVVSDHIDPEKSIALLQEMFAYTLFSGIDNQVAFYLQGPTNCGKTTVLETLQAMLGVNPGNVKNDRTASEMGYSTLSLPELCSDDFAAINLRGKRACISEEINTRHAVDDKAKKFISGGVTTANVKGMPHITFKNRAKFIFASNSDLPVIGDKDSWLSRIILIPFTRQFRAGEAKGEFRKMLGQRFESELSGIFNWTLEGLRRMNDRVSQSKIDDDYSVFTVTDEIRRAKRAYLIRIDSVFAFLESELISIVDEADRNSNEVRKMSASVTDLYGLYRNVSEQDGAKPVMKARFRERLLALGYKIKRGGDRMSSNVYEGIIINKAPKFPSL